MLLIAQAVFIYLYAYFLLPKLTDSQASFTGAGNSIFKGLVVEADAVSLTLTVTRWKLGIGNHSSAIRKNSLP